MVTGRAQWSAARARARRELAALAALAVLVALGASPARAQHNVRRVSLLDMAPSISPDGVLTFAPKVVLDYRFRSRRLPPPAPRPWQTQEGP